MATSRVRRSIQQLSYEYENNINRDLETVIRAFKGIQELPKDDPNSFFIIGGYHGEPFRDRDWPTDKHDYIPTDFWGGYCNHGNVLFPTWHRAYLHRLETAMRTIPGCEDVALPFWDECLDLETTKPIPTILTRQRVELDGVLVDNPLYSYKLQGELKAADGTKDRQRKPEGYVTCRFPMSGLVGTKEDEEHSRNWNARFLENEDKAVEILNGNISNWLKGSIKIPDVPDTKKPKDTSSVSQRYIDSMKAPSYTVFSNTTSAAAWNAAQGDKKEHLAVSLESPHNSIHLAIGGFFQQGNYHANPGEYQQANGDMGENETASLDPIFYLHHAYVDYAFWRWQVKHGLTKRGNLDFIKYYPGTNNVDSPNPDIPPYTELTPQTPLYPFKKSDDLQSHYTSDDVTNIEDLGYTYGKGSLDPYSLTDQTETPEPFITAPPKYTVRAHSINRAEVKGSFIVRVYARLPDKDGVAGGLVEIGREPVLSRFNIKNCANCQITLPVQTFTGLSEELVDHLEAQDVKVKESIEIYLSTHLGPENLKPNFGLGKDSISRPKFEIY